MRTHLVRAGAALGAAALTVSTLFVTAGAAHAVATGNLTVSIVDQYGRPAAGAVMAFDSSGTPVAEDGGSGGGLLGGGHIAPTHTFTGVPVDGYEFEVLTPWSGIDCYGVSPCGVVSGPSAYVPVVNVTADGNAAFTAHVTMPTVTGSTSVPSTLSIATAPNFQTVIGIYSIYGGGGPTTYQWTRDGADIPGATGATYNTVPADGSKQIAARLSPSPGVSLIFGSSGYTVSPYTTQPVTMAKFTPAKTKTKVQVPKSIRVGSRVSLKVKIKSKSKVGGAPQGQVTVTIGQLKIRKKIKNGSVFINLPNLKAGSYKVSVAYSGSDYFAKSKAKTSINVHN